MHLNVYSICVFINNTLLKTVKIYDLANKYGLSYAEDKAVLCQFGITFTSAACKLTNVPPSWFLVPHKFESLEQRMQFGRLFNEVIKHAMDGTWNGYCSDEWRQLSLNKVYRY